MSFLIALVASFAFDVIVTLQFRHIAAGKLTAGLFQPLVALAAVIGFGEALDSAAGAAGYIVGSTVGTFAAMLVGRKNGPRRDP